MSDEEKNETGTEERAEETKPEGEGASEEKAEEGGEVSE